MFVIRERFYAHPVVTTNSVVGIMSRYGLEGSNQVLGQNLRTCPVRLWDEPRPPV